MKKTKMPSSIFIVGKSASGKTCLAKDIMYNFGTVDDIVFNGTEGICPEYGQFVNNSKNVLTELDKSIFKRCEELQKTRKYNPSFLMVFDNVENCLESRVGYSRSQYSMQHMLQIHRHLNISLIITKNTVSDIPPIVRSNIDYLFITKNTCPVFIDSICNKFLTYFSINYILFLMENLEPYECLVVNNFNNELYKYKANIHLSREEVATIAIQKFWKGVLAQRKLQRLKIGNEIELLPVIGKKYMEGLERFNIARN